jgi:hypothetical protein
MHRTSFELIQVRIDWLESNPSFVRWMEMVRRRLGPASEGENHTVSETVGDLKGPSARAFTDRFV